LLDVEVLPVGKHYLAKPSSARAATRSPASSARFVRLSWKRCKALSRCWFATARPAH